jgi:hypothetical protein
MPSKPEPYSNPLQALIDKIAFKNNRFEKHNKRNLLSSLYDQFNATRGIKTEKNSKTDLEYIYQIPESKNNKNNFEIKGVLFLAHGCGHGAGI